MPIAYSTSSDTSGGDIAHDPSKPVLEAIRWTYLALACLVFILGTVNFVNFLIIKGKWRTFPLLMMYICG